MSNLSSLSISYLPDGTRIRISYTRKDGPNHSTKARRCEPCYHVTLASYSWPRESNVSRGTCDASVRRSWFLQVLQSALVATVTDDYKDFGTIGAGALDMTAERLGVNVSEEDKARILGGIRELPPHPEVAESLSRLGEAGIRLATLTNSTRQVAEAQIANAGLTEHFEQRSSRRTM